MRGSSLDGYTKSSHTVPTSVVLLCILTPNQTENQTVSKRQTEVMKYITENGGYYLVIDKGKQGVKCSRSEKVRGVLVFNETGNGHRREAGCQHGVTAPSQFLSHIHKSPQVLKINSLWDPPPP